MKRILYYILVTMAFMSRIFHNKLYMKLIVRAHKTVGVKFEGMPEYIHQDAYLDPSGGLTLSEGCVISTRTIILTHDWSFLKRISPITIHHPPAPERDIYTIDLKPFTPVVIGRNSFIGAGAIILPGSQIGENCIIGAGAVIKGKIESGSIMVGNPAHNIAQLH